MVSHVKPVPVKRQYCLACTGANATREIGFLCRECWEALVWLREYWQESGKTSRLADPPRHPDLERRIELYAARAARREPLFQD